MPPLIDIIRANIEREQALRLELLAQPSNLARIEKSERIMAALTAAGLRCHDQQLFSVEPGCNGPKLHLLIHVHIHRDHYRAGHHVLDDVLEPFGDCEDQERDIEVLAHRSDFGWQPADAEKKAAA